MVETCWLAQVSPWLIAPWVFWQGSFVVPLEERLLGLQVLSQTALVELHLLERQVDWQRS